VEATLLYQFGDDRTNAVEDLRFMTHVAETEQDAMIHYQSTDGQGLTLVHFSAQRQRFFMYRGCV
jgi:hypothetical protein